MPKRLDFIVKPGYVPPLELDETAFEEVWKSFPLADETKAESARAQLRYILEEVLWRKENTVRARSPKRELSTLSELLELVRAAATETRRKGEAWARADRFAKDLAESDPVVTDDLRLAFREARISFPRTPDAFATNERVILGLMKVIEGTQGRGRPTNWTATWFATHVYRIWKEFTKRGTGSGVRGSRYDEDGAFVTFHIAAGRLVGLDCAGYHHARGAHEKHRRDRTGAAIHSGDAERSRVPGERERNRGARKSKKRSRSLKQKVK